MVFLLGDDEYNLVCREHERRALCRSRVHESSKAGREGGWLECRGLGPGDAGIE